MPAININKTRWDGGYKWTNRGDEWSEPWGNPSMQWYGTILPRIKSHVPSTRILEIACGYGRWTQYLKDLCKDLSVIDLSEECIEACKERFATSSNIEYYVNDGKSLEMISDSSVDFIFSFDSLVHADESVLEAYICQFQRILSDNGVAFIHHSNLGEYKEKYASIRRLPKLEGLLVRLGILEQHLHWRDFSVDAKKVEILANKYGLKCIGQEMVTWGTKNLFIDCMSTIVKQDSLLERNNHILRNDKFMKEAQNLLQLSKLYV